MAFKDALTSDRSSIQTCCFAHDSIRNMRFWSYVIFLLRDESDDWMIERFSKAMGAALVGNNFSPILWNFISHEKKKWLVVARNLQSIKTFLALELSQYRKSMVSSSEPVAARSDCRRLGNAPCLCSSVRHAQAEPENGPKSLAVDFASKPSITFWNSLWSDCKMTCRGSNLDSNLNSVAWPTSWKGFIASEITA